MKNQKKQSLKIFKNSIFGKNKIKVTFHYEKHYWIVYERETSEGKEEENLRDEDFLGFWVAT